MKTAKSFYWGSFFLFVILSLTFLTSMSVSATVYYVATDGNDGNPGTEALPWQTIQKAAKTMVAGDTVYIRSGTYNERVIPENSVQQKQNVRTILSAGMSNSNPITFLDKFVCTDSFLDSLLNVFNEVSFTIVMSFIISEVD